MNDVEKYTQLLCNAIRSSGEFIRYENAKQKLAEHNELIDSLNAFRKKCYDAQVIYAPEQLPEVMEQLCQEQKQLFASPVISEYVSSEQEYCTMVREQYLKLAGIADLQLEPLKL